MNDTTNEANSEPADDLERELQSMTPRGLSHEARQQVGRQISETSSRRPVQIAMTAAIAIAASVLLLIGWFVWQPGKNPDENIVQPKERNSDNQEQVVPNDPHLAIASAGDSTVPTMWTYRRAVNNSFDDLDRLLAQHGHGSMGGETPMAFHEIGVD